MRITAFLKPLSFLPAIALMYMIYSFSGEDAETSSGLSYKLSRKIVQTVNRISDQNWEDWQMDQKAGKLEFYVRKFAHMSEYFLLAVAVSFPLYVYGIRGLFLMILAFLICIAYAAGDEYHQTFISGRDGSFRDVGIDGIGILAGIILVRLFGWSGRVAIEGPRIEREQRAREAVLDRRERELSRREREITYREQQMERQIQRQRESLTRAEREKVLRGSYRILEEDQTRIWPRRKKAGTDEEGQPALRLRRSLSGRKKSQGRMGAEDPDFDQVSGPTRRTLSGRPDAYGRYDQEEDCLDEEDEQMENISDSLSEDMPLFLRRKHPGDS